MNRVDRRAFLTTLTSGLALASAATRVRGQPVSSFWSEQAPMPWAVQEVYATVVADRIVVAGGLRSAGNELQIEDRTGIYDPLSNAWEEGPRLPAPRHHPMLVAGDDGRVYAFGGFARGDGGEWNARTEVWAIDSNRWIDAGAMPEPQCETVGALLGGRIHLVTGRSPIGSANANWQDHGDIAKHWVFEPSSGRWEAAHPAPIVRNSAAGAVINGALYVVGGRTVGGGNTARLERYDPRTDAWDVLAPMPQAAGGLAAGTAAGMLWAFGGEWFGVLGRGVYAETWMYDPARDNWTPGPPMLTPRHGLAAASINGMVYAIGGATIAGAAGTSTSVEALS